MTTTLFLALRGLRFRWKQSFVAILGVFVGVTALTAILSVSNGFERGLVDQILETAGHLQVWSRSHQIWRYPEVVEEIARLPEVTAAVPCILAQAIVEHEEAFTGVRVKGIDAAAERKLVDFTRFMKEGAFTFTAREQLLMGEGLAEKLGVSVGDQVRLIVPGAEEPPRLLVMGLFDTGIREFDHEMVFVPMAEAQSLLGFGDNCSHIFVKTSRPLAVRELAGKIRAAVSLETTTWLDSNRVLLEALSMEKRVMFLVILLTLVVASFGIANLLTMMVYEKISDIGILRAIGLGRRGILRIFVTKGFLIGVAGTVLGCLGGWSLGLLLRSISIPLPSDIYYVDRVPVEFHGWDFAMVALLACLVASLAGWLPARKAASIEPYQAIRHLQ